MRRNIKSILAFIMSLTLLSSTIPVTAANTSEMPDHAVTVTAESVDSAHETLEGEPETANNEPVVESATCPSDDVETTPEAQASSEASDITEADEASVAKEPGILPEDIADESSTISSTDTTDEPDYVVDESGLVWYKNDPEASASKVRRVKTYSLATRSVVAIPTSYQEVHDRIMAFKTKEGYTEGTPWTNSTPYGENGPWGLHYVFQGGYILNARYMVGCAAFVGELQDSAFGDLPARTIYNFDPSELRVGDTIRLNDKHFVIVTAVSAGGVIVAEANYNGTVHWDRVISTDEIKQTANFYVTRYPENFVPSDAENAETVVQSGTENGLTWTLTGAGTLTISGNGAIPNYISGSTSPSWNAFAASISTIVIEDGITSIGNYAFSGSHALSAYLPNSITSIGQGAFQDSKLINVTIPGSVQTLGNTAFQGCANLTSVSTNEGLKTIGVSAFQSCTALQYIDFPSTVTSIGSSAFSSCEKLLSARFAPGATKVTLGENLFTKCWALTSVTLPEQADRISGGMFAGCISLPYLYIPKGIGSIESVASIAGSPFMQTNMLTLIEFGGTAAEWQNKGGNTALQYAGKSQSIMKFGVEFENPFANDDDDVSDLIPDEEDPVDPPAPPDPPEPPVEPDPVDPPNPAEHEHQWNYLVWAHDAEYHWHDCEADGCTISSNDLKAGYAEHIYGEWTVDVAATATQDGSQHRDCPTCAYRQIETIPATGESSDDPDDSDENDDEKDDEDKDDNDDNDNEDKEPVPPPAKPPVKPSGTSGSSKSSSSNNRSGRFSVLSSPNLPLTEPVAVDNNIAKTLDRLPIKPEIIQGRDESDVELSESLARFGELIGSSLPSDESNASEPQIGLPAVVSSHEPATENEPANPTMVIVALAVIGGLFGIYALKFRRRNLRK